MAKLCESAIEEMVIEELQSLGYTYISGVDLAPDALNPERSSYGDVLLMGRLQTAVHKLNPTIPADAIQGAVRKLSRIATSNLLADNEEFHKMLVDGVSVEYRKGSDIKGDSVRIVDFDCPLNNEFLVVNQYTVVQNNNNKRPDVLLFVNGIPLVIFELKNPADENATCNKAYEQLQAYKLAIPGLFTYNEICIISDGLEAKAGSLTAPYSRFSTWKTKDGIKEAAKFDNELSTLIHGLCNPATLIDYIQNFVTYEKTQTEDKVTHIVKVETVKKIAAYHQYYAVNKALEQTIRASGYSNNSTNMVREDPASYGLPSASDQPKGDRKAGVIWHTQGSGKSLSMVFYTGKIVRALNNPTIVVITDRNDLDDQLFDTFAGNSQLLRQPPTQANSCEELKTLLKVASGGIVFTTIQKFIPDNNESVYELLSDRDNIVVIADEAHRTQYGFNAKLRDIKENGEVVGQRIAYGFAKYIRDALPNATFIGFTGTPVEKQDANTPAVFGNYIDIYDIAQAVEDKVTVRIYYESRLAKVNLTEEGKRLIEQFDAELDEVGEADEATKAKIKWAKLEAIVGNEDRIRILANDIVTHFEERQKVFEGKALIVAMSRRIAVEIYDAIVKLRPEWHSDDLDKGSIKVVMTSSSSDGAAIQKHHTTKAQRKALALRLKDENDPLKIVIVRDMWLTGFDAPCLNTMYIDKPMKDHNLMQAIARVNRVFKDKPGGLIVDYIGIATNLKKALGFYAESGGKGVPAETHQKAVEIMLEKLEVVRCILYGFDYSAFFSSAVKDKLSLILQAEDFILGLDDGKNRFIREVSLLGQAYALAKPDPATFENAEEIAFFQAVKARLTKFETGGNGKGESYDSVIRNIVNSAISSDQVVDIFGAAGLEKPELSILSEEFLKEIEGMKYKNVAIELLKKLLSDEIKIRSKHNLAKSKTLMEMLDGAIKRYQNNLLTTAEIIEELIRIAREINAADKRGQDMGLSEDELAFYDALETNDSAVKVLGDDQLRAIAREIADKVRKNATIDFAIKETARARIMVIVRRILNKYGYPPDKQPAAIELVMKQAENLADVWSSQ
ncbi:Restriction endonuclease, type I, HsdR [Syntrophomonas zehnderi OL-4]|uniref:Type I restriction enzyme endonuclease subunit n=1 Tax=Syntrophomonas zehnderi OL-4 TaxID=690567 RepID=A0A0E4GAE4_9FIRM|nr:type I restriction endonuclease subunit R [Syntrophomonas zehnderi]CFX07600.1 Restriction endonuclease, type I, HsdR [Syntrophomonas zehnderi OL-4]CFX31660.1 Restriction endonuclease, type I, HsdR [Syntrophomonas zehnderi OL-4]